MPIRLRLLKPYMCLPVGSIIEAGAGEAASLLLRKAATRELLEAPPLVQHVAKLSPPRTVDVPGPRGRKKR